MKYCILSLLVGLTFACARAKAQNTPTPDDEFDQIMDQELDQSHAQSTTPVPAPAAATTFNAPATSSGPTTNTKGPIYVHNPLAEKGLYRITADGTYLYKTKRQVSHQAASISFGEMSPPNIVNPTNGASYKNLYGSQPSTGVLFNYEYQFWRGVLGKLAVKLGSGAIIASGHGEFVSPSMQGLTPLERFTFYTFPNNAGLIYRMQFWDNQPLIPYVEGGGDYYTFIEDRNDQKPARYGGAPAMHVAVGVALNLNIFDPQHLSMMGEDYGISTVYLYGEFRQVVGLQSQLDFSSQIISGGVLAEF